MFDDLKKRIKEVGIESKKYLADVEHPYHKLGGILKAQVIFLYIGIVSLIIANLYFISLLTKINGRFAWNALKFYYGIPDSLIMFLLFILVVVDIYCFAIMIIMIKKIKNKEKDILLFIHGTCIVGFVLYIVSLFSNFSRGLGNILSLAIGCIVVTLYYLLSVRVRVYFGGDEFIRRDSFIRFLLEPDYTNDYAYTNNQSKINNNIRYGNDENENSINQKNVIVNDKNEIIYNDLTKSNENSLARNTNIENVVGNDVTTRINENANGIETNTKSDILDNCRKVNECIEQLEKTESKESIPIEDLDAKVKKEVANLKTETSKAVISQASDRTKPNANVNVNDNSKKESVKVIKYYIKEKQKKHPILKAFKTLILSIIKILLIVTLFFVLLNFNGKYNITENTIIQKIYTTIDNALSNILHIKLAPPISVISDFNMVVEPNSNDDYSNSNNNSNNSNANLNNISNDYSNNNLNNDINNNTDKQISNNNHYGKTNIPNQNKLTAKIEKNAVKISSKVKKLGETIALWQYNDKEGAWNLFLGKRKSLAKDSVYIMNYISPVTGEECSSTYYFDKLGRLVTGWGVDFNGDYYFFNDDKYDIGKMCTGWKIIDGDEYYFSSNGRLLVDTITPDGAYVDINGKKISDNIVKKNVPESNNNKVDDYYNKSTR